MPPNWTVRRARRDAPAANVGFLGSIVDGVAQIRRNEIGPIPFLIGSCNTHDKDSMFVGRTRQGLRATRYLPARPGEVEPARHSLGK